MKVAVIVGGWYFPAHLFINVKDLIAPKGWETKLFVAAHRDPSKVDISSEMLSRIEPGKYENLDKELFSQIADFDYLRELGFVVDEFENAIGDYYFFNQWADKYSYRDYDYVIFMHDDNYLLPKFKHLLTDLFQEDLTGFKHIDGKWTPHSTKGFDYIANSAGGTGTRARGSFSIWSRDFITAMGGKFPMDNVALTRVGQTLTPTNHFDLADWNQVGSNLQGFVENNGYMDTTFRLSNNYRVSAYMVEGERGLISKQKLLREDMDQGFNHYAAHQL